MKGEYAYRLLGLWCAWSCTSVVGGIPFMWHGRVYDLKMDLVTRGQGDSRDGRCRSGLGLEMMTDIIRLSICSHVKQERTRHLWIYEQTPLSIPVRRAMLCQSRCMLFALSMQLLLHHQGCVASQCLTRRDSVIRDRRNRSHLAIRRHTTRRPRLPVA